MVLISTPVLLSASFLTLMFASTSLSDASATLLFFFFACLVFRSVWRRLENKDKSIEEKIDILYKHLILKDLKDDNKK